MAALKWYNKPWVGLQWMFFHKGPAATNHFEGGGFIRVMKRLLTLTSSFIFARGNTI
jgi:hypothetical protein